MSLKLKYKNILLYILLCQQDLYKIIMWKKKYELK